MYFDTILFSVGGLLLLVAFLFLIALLRSRRAGREYQRILREETERIDVLTTLERSQKEKFSQTETSSPSTTPSISAESSTYVTEKASDTLEESDIHSEDLDFSALRDKYELLREIHGGNMSRVFLARHKKLGYECVVKWIEGERPELANEAEVLKKINHISIPQIMDVIPSQPFEKHGKKKQGTFLVERYIEGFSLNQAMQIDQPLPEGQICDWGLQLAQVLHYLHSLENPIYHCDLKPANIMVTYNNRLVLLDFGISRWKGSSKDVNYLTYAYAAPEQFQKTDGENPMIRKRFGTLLPDQPEWNIDERTDLYSVGVILYRLAVGRLPEYNTVPKIYDHASRPFADIICKCLNIRPEERFQSAMELSIALEKVYHQRGSAAHRLFLRRIAAAVCACAMIGGTLTTASAAYLNRMERLSTLSVEPWFAVVTVQQSIEPFVEKHSPNGDTSILDDHLIQWSYSVNNIAKMDHGRLYGINTGKTEISGQYRNKTISLEVEVVEPAGEMTEISLCYPQGIESAVYAGNGERRITDGSTSVCAFISPESMSMDGGRLYLTDSGNIRVVENGVVSTIPLKSDYLTADLIRVREGEIYIRTGPWYESEESAFYGFARVRDGAAEVLFRTEAAWSVITDFAISSNGIIWFLQQNMGSGATTLNTLNPDNRENAWVMDLPYGASSLAFDQNDTLYISVPESGIILRVKAEDKSWSYFAGLEDVRNMIDGTMPNFYRPTALAADKDTLYVLDFDTVRKISMNETEIVRTETTAGTPTGELNPKVVLGEGCQTVFPVSDLASLVVCDDGSILLSDPKNSVIYRIAA